MRHLKARTKLNITASHRKALFRNLANALFDHERIKTTNPKAMELRRLAERLITLAKKNVFSEIGSRYVDINGGYTRVVKVGRRRGDAAPMAIIELTQRKEEEREKKAEGKKAKEKKPKAAKAKEAKVKGEKPKKEAKPAKAKAKETEADTTGKKPRTRKARKAESEGTEA
jgi:large subunit ribosomal protein L17